MTEVSDSDGRSSVIDSEGRSTVVWKRQWWGSDSAVICAAIDTVARGKQGLTTAQFCGHFSFSSGDPARHPGGDALGLRRRFRPVFVRILGVLSSLQVAETAYGC